MSDSDSAKNAVGDVDYDVVIAGGGMVGISFALLLNRLSAGRLRILVAESFALPATDNTAPVYRPSFDARATALAYGSRCIFDNLGIWNTLQPYATAITDIHVSERNRFGSVVLNAQQRGWPALGHVIENAWLGSVLISELRKHSAIEWLNPAHVSDCQPGGDCATVVIEHNGQQKSLRTKLLAIADGAQSGLRTRLNIGTREHDYRQQAIIANICCSKPHQGWAYERFTDWGPMALLPLAATHSSEARMALVWTMKPAQAQELLNNSDADFLRALQQRFGYRQGNFVRVGQRFAYDLKLTTASEQVRRQIVLIGNAAHSLHPVAGQGFNLALRDVQRLAEIVAQASTQNEQIGELRILRHYLDQQAADQSRTLLFSDRITALFERPGMLVGGMRHVGLLALDLNTQVKNIFVDQTAGYRPGAALGKRAG